MFEKRWWDIAFAGGGAVLVVGILVGLGPDPGARRIEGIVAVAVFAALYVGVARPLIGTAPPLWRYIVLVAVFGVMLVAATSISPFLSILQTLAYPLVWVMSPDRRRAIIASGAIALSVWLGVFWGGGFDGGAFVSATTTGVLSFAFATAFGLWIYRIAEDGEERGRLLAELTAAQEQVEALSRERGAATERERLARDIHDTLAQTLAGLVLLAERAGAQSRDGQADAAAATIATVEQSAREALGEARALVSRTAAVPGDAVLEAAVDRLVHRFRAEAGLTIDASVDVVEGAASIGREAQVVVLRCLQEGLANVHRHAAATFVRVGVAVDAAGAVRVRIVDDGRGFDPTSPGSGYGLDGMRERVGLAGGELRIDSAPGRGTEVLVRLPAAAASDESPPRPAEGDGPADGGLGAAASPTNARADA
ncbi:sensor histidine kinase [Microbacterium sp. LRZ72]|uniref:sensor histidine kinase n=1 Tax=Microbacterium sp. LRZ72 TaxID=2942481 RepID=UPI0029A22CDB|nr:sensor histidine kinase [Microbacterium sp. LRZ72]MDX2376802.1 sensor histidine kinase [Microbacterium sp. LRZ72]